MKIPYHCCTKQFEDYYVQQTGHGLPYYSGVAMQRGYGLGNIFGRFFRVALPFLKQGAKTVGKQILRSGADIVDDVIKGENVKIAAKRRLGEAGKILSEKAVAKTRTMFGAGNKRKRKKVKRIILAKRPRASARDIFDP